MADQTGSLAKAVAGAALLPAIGMSVVLLTLAAAGAPASNRPAGCAGGGTAQHIGAAELDAEQIGNAQSIVAVTAGRRLPVYAAVVAVTTAYTESALHNSSVHFDHDSEGLFQQRVSIYPKAVADDPVWATNAFLDRLTGTPNWQTNPVGIDAQTVQISAYPQRYQPNASLAARIVGRLWPTAAALPAAGTSKRPAGSSGPVPAMAPVPDICPGGGGAGNPAGAQGNNVAGTTRIPAGLVLSGSPQARIAVQFALHQLGKPYLFGAAGPGAWDCSGLTMGAWAAAGLALPHWTGTQAQAGTPEPTNLSQALGGDLVFIPGSDGTPASPGHVGMVAGYLDTKDGRHLYLIQAAQTGVPVELTDASEWSGQIVGVRHIG